MADFKISYNITVLGNEGGLNPGNGEAFTYRGIDESQNPNWPGFKLVHAIYEANKHLGLTAVNKILAANVQLQTDIQNFYLVNYWNNVKPGYINDQQVANILFDDSVNPCEVSCAHIMQQACGLCNAPVAIDGNIGRLTIGAVNSIKPEMYYNAIVNIRKFHYNHEVITHPKQRQWLNTWLTRLVSYKN